MRVFRRAIGLSLGIHLVALGWFGREISRRLMILTSPKLDAIPLRVDWIGTIVDPGSVVADSNAQKRNTIGSMRREDRKAGNVSAQKLFSLVSGNSGFAAQGTMPDVPGHITGSSGWYGISAHVVGSRLGMEGQMRLMPLFQAIQARIESSIDYPRELHESGQRGNVRIEFEVAPTGRLHGDFEDVEASNSYLKVYVLRVLEKVLQADYVPKPRDDFRYVRLQLVFDFDSSLERDNYDRVKLAYGHKLSRNVLSFHRRGEARRGFHASGGKVSADGSGGELSFDLGFDFDALFSKDVRKATRRIDWRPRLEAYRQDPWFTDRAHYSVEKTT